MKPELKALIIDDEAMACDMLEYLLLQNISSITSIKKATSAAEGLQLIYSFYPDIIFLDIQMPFMNGFELLSKIPKHYFSVIFTTAYSKYAIQAIRFSALDYLLKPVDKEELIQAVDRHIQQGEEKKQVKELYLNFINNLNNKEQKQLKLALPSSSGLRIASPTEIIHCTGINNYTQFHLVDGTNMMVSKTIKEFEEMLADHGFIRTHKSHLVNREYVKEIRNDNIIVLKNGQQVEISRRRQHDVLEALKK
ncbi:MAG: response regulator transcription factor [Chitinophagaceae bacterium]|nr:response regulator transcription factor [Chitinophagaceae bacterium]